MFDLPDAVEMAVVVGRNADAVAEAAEKWGWAESATDWREVIARDDIDIVDIVTPGDSHAEIAIAALEAGKHVLCEKPLANTVEEAEAMADAAARAAERGVRSMVGFTYRRVPAVTFLRDLIAEGVVGTVQQVRAAYRQDWLVDPEMPLAWRLQKEHAGSGALGDIGAHIIDMTQFVTGQTVDAVSGTIDTIVKERPLLGSGSGLSGNSRGGLRRGHRRRRRALHRAPVERRARLVRGDPLRDGAQERPDDRGLGRQGRARVRPRRPQQPAVLRPHRARRPAGLHEDPGHRGAASVRRRLVARRPHARLRARLQPPGRRPRDGDRRGHRPAPVASPRASRCSACSTPSSGRARTNPPGSASPRAFRHPSERTPPEGEQQ